MKNFTYDILSNQSPNDVHHIKLSGIYESYVKENPR
jgi:hypothetical protein